MRSIQSQHNGSVCHVSFTPESLPGQVEQYLQKSSYRTLRRIGCACENGRLILQGQVDSFYLKQVAQVLAQQVIGALAIDNRLQVVIDSPTVTVTQPASRAQRAELDAIA
jgi:osmotically-inducible protein OsmY